jgi:hypothetical protein
MLEFCYLFWIKSQFKSQLLSRKTKILIYKTLVRPVLTYAAETWTTTKNDERRLSIFDRKILCRIYGPIFKRGQWRKRYSTELEELCNEPNTVKVIKSNRLRWVGLLVRMDDMNYLKRYCGQTLEVNKAVADCSQDGLMG